MDKPSKTSTRSREEQAPAIPPSRKRQIDSDSNDEPAAKRTQLTRKNLALFDKMGKKKASDPTDDSKSTRTTSATTSGFADKACKNGILHPLLSKPPTNLEDFCKRHTRTRATASPPESVFEDYINIVERAGNEATMVFEVGGQLLKKYYDKGYNRSFNRSFTNVPPNAGYNNGLSAPQPDFIEGLGKEEFRPFPVTDHISGATLYEDDPLSLTLPHVAGEWKGPGKDMNKARLQSAYDGAAMVHARNSALSYMGKPDPPGHSEVTTFTTDGTNINFYAHYAVPSNKDPDELEYHQYQYASANVKDSYQGHKDGRKGLRNAQDHAREQSYALKDQLKEHWEQPRDAPQTFTEQAPLPAPDTDEDKATYDIIEQPCQPTPTASLPPEDDHDASRGNRKRKASPPPRVPPRPRRSKAKPYWVLDDKSGEYYHKHSDGTTSWFNDDNNNKD